MKVSRRRFLKITGIAGGGLLLSLQLPLFGGKAAGSPLKSHTLHLYIEIDDTGAITVNIAKHEMGQGLETGIARIVADELDADWEKLRVKRFDVNAASHAANLGFDDFGTGGSYSIRSLWSPLRQAGATVREMLKQAAANEWQVKIDQCVTRDGCVLRVGTNDVFAYGDLAEKAAQLPVPTDPPLKARSDFHLIGQPCTRIDPKDRVCGTTPYSIDLEIPGMLHASLLRAPVKGGKLISCDSSKVFEISGVRQVIELTETPTYAMWARGAKNSVAVLADSTWTAMKGREALVVEWDHGPNAQRDAAGIFDEFADPEKVTTEVRMEMGPFEEKMGAGERFSASYHSPYLAHAMMEPLNAIAWVHENGDVEVWVGTQNAHGAAQHIAWELDIDIDKITVHPYPSGGAFGRRYFTDYIIEAVLLAQKAKVPVKLMWTREDEIRHGRYHPFRKDDYEVTFDEAGNILAWRFDGYTTHDWGAWTRVPVSVESHRCRSHTIKDKLVNYGPWRSVMKHLEVFSYECFVDELAHKLGRDPLEYRLQLLIWPESLALTDDWRRKTSAEYAGLSRVLCEVATMAGWGRALPPGVGLGIGVGNYNECYCAEIAEVEERDGDILIRKIYCAVDCGIVIHPNQVEAQIEGGILWALTPLLYGGIDVRQGVVVQSNFDDLQVLAFNDTPEIEIRILESDRDPVGVGEPSVPPLAPACLNAIYAATGKRIRSLPYTSEYQQTG